MILSRAQWETRGLVASGHHLSHGRWVPVVPLARVMAASPVGRSRDPSARFAPAGCSGKRTRMAAAAR